MFRLRMDLLLEEGVSMKVRLASLGASFLFKKPNAETIGRSSNKLPFIFVHGYCSPAR